VQEGGKSREKNMTIKEQKKKKKKNKPSLPISPPPMEKKTHT